MLNPKRDRSIETDFDAWLDAFVAGQTAPMSPGTDMPSVTERQDAANRFHALAAAKAGTSLDGTSAELDAIWGNVMQRTTPTPNHAPRSVPSAAEMPLDRRRARRLSADLPGGPKVHAAINSLLAAGLILAVMAGFWRVTGGFSPGGDDGQELPFGAAVETPQAGTPDPIVSDKGTPILSKAPPIDMPEPSDCKVEPLSVDDVLAIVDNPDVADRTPIYVIEDRASPPPGGWYGTEGPGYTLLNQPPSQAQLDAIAADHFERVACELSGSWFHVWALTDPTLVYRDVTERLYPLYITRDEARALLEELNAKGAAGGLPLLSEQLGDPTAIALIDPDPAHSNQVFDVQVQVGTLVYDESGKRYAESGKSAGLLDQEGGGDNLYTTYVWSETAGHWLFLDYTAIPGPSGPGMSTIDDGN